MLECVRAGKRNSSKYSVIWINSQCVWEYPISWASSKKLPVVQQSSHLGLGQMLIDQQTSRGKKLNPCNCGSGIELLVDPQHQSFGMAQDEILGLSVQTSLI